LPACTIKLTFGRRREQAFLPLNALGLTIHLLRSIDEAYPHGLDWKTQEVPVMRKTAVGAIAGLVLMLGGCSPQPNYILAMTTFEINGSATGVTVIEGFRSKDKSQSAGDQWRNSVGDGFGRYVCLEPKQ
jgi:hypothetical protein